MPAEINDIAMRASVAAVSKGSSIRVYESDGKIGSPVAATSLGLDFIRVYYIGEDNKAREICYDKHGRHWYNGALNDRFRLAPYSGLAAIYLEAPDDQKLIRIYGQLEDDNTIQEWCYDTKHGWTLGSNIGDAVPGSSIAATTWAQSPHQIRVYVQDANLNIIEKAYDGSRWHTGGLHIKDATPRAAVGVTSWTEHGNVSIRLYYGSPGNVIKEKAWDHGKGWYDGDFSQGSVPASHVAATPKPTLRVYIQNGTKYTAVTEFAWEGRWDVGQQALPPA
ncbi:hypothetical protein MAC_07308 [Metarhizium acridum CQMa 102]|uniref:Uncharacterized protein n=1 Tax=Metarhizium acridum (strain CQMa 102) TaxID=655827 RepID=E9EBR0_METAQ|nr:uncharacterized protein MAC_07308 [Metarhizium acridum CQMa 102]EFY86619.1 hypothetical protein MAC_07308 [Metarhizium acridum CQMa 102]